MCWVCVDSMDTFISSIKKRDWTHFMSVMEFRHVMELILFHTKRVWPSCQKIQDSYLLYDIVKCYIIWTFNFLIHKKGIITLHKILETIICEHM